MLLGGWLLFASAKLFIWFVAGIWKLENWLPGCTKEPPSLCFDVLLCVPLFMLFLCMFKFAAFIV